MAGAAPSADKLRSALEKIKAAIRESLGPKDQLKFLGMIDGIQQAINNGQITQEALQGPIFRAKASTRKTLREDPLAMSQLLNGFENLEEEIMRILAELD